MTLDLHQYLIVNTVTYIFGRGQRGRSTHHQKERRLQSPAAHGGSSRNDALLIKKDEEESLPRELANNSCV